MRIDTSGCGDRCQRIGSGVWMELSFCVSREFDVAPHPPRVLDGRSIEGISGKAKFVVTVISPIESAAVGGALRCKV
jgi:hypothetical protein